LTWVGKRCREIEVIQFLLQKTCSQEFRDVSKETILEIRGIIWIEEIVEKLEKKHSVTCREVIELLASSPRYRFVEKGHRPGENVYAALGTTDSGRYLIRFFVFKNNRQALVISARDMTETKRKRYEKG
jgi:uncharacterized DUF497 family protein